MDPHLALGMLSKRKEKKGKIEGRVDIDLNQHDMMWCASLARSLPFLAGARAQASEKSEEGKHGKSCCP